MTTNRWASALSLEVHLETSAGYKRKRLVRFESSLVLELFTATFVRPPPILLRPFSLLRVIRHNAFEHLDHVDAGNGTADGHTHAQLIHLLQAEAAQNQTCRRFGFAAAFKETVGSSARSSVSPIKPQSSSYLLIIDCSLNQFV
jgi:hypothetical protein